MTGSVDGSLPEMRAYIVQLQAALETRSVIARAQGMVMERYGIDCEAALSVLKRASSTAQSPVRVVAAELITTRRLPAGFVGAVDRIGTAAAPSTGLCLRPAPE
jgi:hypothetical protein